ncbi:uncharacterized protein LOC132198349 [Neocloeon triangulifer]|uniref:uncharacterized protein LOC132198349 n=1 Tax=Neocloeon triangulifer TaxID=2078957 RepID=UPI00286ED55D|nr:uncharacterized protein LOC132198349 [Neocloeon triangulifer]
MMGEIFRSSVPINVSNIPNCSLTNCLFKYLRQNLHIVAQKPWLIDVCTEKKILFGQVEERSRNVAKALARRGFAKGDVLYFVSYDIVDIGVLQLAVWLLGGATRGSYQISKPEEYARQMQEAKCKFVAVDSHTVETIKQAIKIGNMDCDIINVGDEAINGVLSFMELTQDDNATLLPKVQIDSDKDVFLICNTSGSTGEPKGVIHTHKNFLSVLSCFKELMAENFDESIMLTASNFSIFNAWTMTLTLATGNTMFCMSRYRKEEFLGHVLKYKPWKIFLYPYIMSWFARRPELDKHDFGFLKNISLGGSVVDPTTLELLQKKFPKANFNLTYATTECLGVATTPNNINLSLFGTSPDGERMVTSGFLFPLVEAKIIDLETGDLLGKNKLGLLFVRSLQLTKGYLVKDSEPDRSCFDCEGWFDTGDIAFFDTTGQLFVRERVSFMFKYYMHFVIPSEIEAVLQEHSAVQLACVIAVPNMETTNLARGLVVLKNGENTTEEELLALVARKLPLHKHLHGGLQFVESLPENKGRKLDRMAIIKQYISHL